VPAEGNECVTLVSPVAFVLKPSPKSQINNLFVNGEEDGAVDVLSNRYVKDLQGGNFTEVKARFA
jgi:hypothetical protein